MRRSKKPIVLASRRSPLARAQAVRVGEALRQLNPSLEIVYRWADSQGDLLQEVTSAGFGGKGLFTRTIEKMLLNERADIAVHSLKDLPVQNTQGLTIAAIGKRAMVHDVLVSAEGYHSLADLPDGATLGTSSGRRAAHVLRLRPDVRIVPLRGNVDTRIARVMAEPSDPELASLSNGAHDPSAAMDATILAGAGLQRLGRKELLEHRLSLKDMIPAAGQGALAIQCRSDDHTSIARCVPLNHADTATAVESEREVLARLGAGCHSAIGVLVTKCESPRPVRRNAEAHWYRLRLRLLSPDGRSHLTVDERVMTPELRRLVQRSVETLNEQGAQGLLAAAEQSAAAQANHGASGSMPTDRSARDVGSPPSADSDPEPSRPARSVLPPANAPGENSGIRPGVQPGITPGNLPGVRSIV